MTVLRLQNYIPRLYDALDHECRERLANTVRESQRLIRQSEKLIARTKLKLRLQARIDGLP